VSLVLQLIQTFECLDFKVGEMITLAKERTCFVYSRLMQEIQSFFFLFFFNSDFDSVTEKMQCTSMQMAAKISSHKDILPKCLSLTRLSTP